MTASEIIYGCFAIVAFLAILGIAGWLEGAQ